MGPRLVRGRSNLSAAGVGEVDTLAVCSEANLSSRVSSLSRRSNICSNMGAMDGGSGFFPMQLYWTGYPPDVSHSGVATPSTWGH